MKKIIIFIFMILTCFYNTCFADIIQTNDTKVIEETLASIDPDTLVIFDVDEVLLQYFDNKNRVREKIKKISCSQQGEILKAFLNQINIQPKSIVFIDDNLENLQSVENCAKEKNIEFVGFEYNVVKNRQIQTLNEEREKLKFDVLLKEKKWISDSEADALLSNSAKLK